MKGRDVAVVNWAAGMDYISGLDTASISFTLLSL